MATKEKVKMKNKKVDPCLFKNLDLPAEVALYYGFTILDVPQIKKEDVKKAKSFQDSESKNKDVPDVPTKTSLLERVALLRLYGEKNFQNLPQPLMLYFGKPILPEGIKKSSAKERVVSLEIMGTAKSIAEAILIKTTMEILKEEGYENLSIQINSMGEKDTVARFARELTAYYRKNIDELPAHCRQLMKKDIFDLLSCKNEKCRILKESSPKIMNFLSEPSRVHFKEVLEYLEMLDIPYEINHFLVGNRSFASQTLFEIHDAESKEVCVPLAVGVRYASIAKKIGMKRDVPGVGVRLTFKEKNVQKNLKFLRPKIYFIQLGFEAKLKSLKIIEILRQAKIPMHHGISRDKLVSQLSSAENMRIPYTLIMGQKEALEDTVIVRCMTDRSQESIKIEHLPKYLKKL
ncbi:MAG: His/Gly/Thr/Pro-type tRNA ligase C-terminal domain-containing protein [Patescibacteria group bacterium]